jgi:hypothetical protein
MTATAIKQWVLTEDESVESLRSWRDHLLIILAHEECFAPFLTTGAAWSRKSRNNTFRGFTGPDAANLAARLELMLGLIATAAPVLSRHTIIKTSTSLSSIWEALWRYYGFHPCVPSSQYGLQSASCIAPSEDEVCLAPMECTIEQLSIIAPNDEETDDEIFNETPVDDQPEECDIKAPVFDKTEVCRTEAPVVDQAEMCNTDATMNDQPEVYTTEAPVSDQSEEACSTSPEPCIDGKSEGEEHTLSDIHTNDDREKNQIFLDDLAKDVCDEHIDVPMSIMTSVPTDPNKRGTLRHHDEGSAMKSVSPSRAEEGISESPFPCCEVAEAISVVSSPYDETEEESRAVSSPCDETEEESRAVSSPCDQTEEESREVSSPCDQTEEESREVSSPYDETEEESPAGSSPYDETEEESPAGSSPYDETEEESPAGSSPYDETEEESRAVSLTRDVAEKSRVGPFSREICSLGVRDDDDLGIVFLDGRSDAGCEEEGDASNVVAGLECAVGSSLRTRMTQTSTVPTVQHVQSVSEFMCNIPVLGVVLTLSHGKIIITSNLTARYPQITREVGKETTPDATRPCTTPIASTGRPPDSMFFATIGTSGTQDLLWLLTLLFVLN